MNVKNGVVWDNTMAKIESKQKPLSGKKLVDAVVESLEEKLAEKIAVIDLKGFSGAADWFIVCEGDNASHTTAIAGGVIDALKEKYATRPWHCEGLEEGRWALIDYSDVVVHVMLPEARKYYDLESLWARQAALP
jgi:ribosome-associated protein